MIPIEYTRPIDPPPTHLANIDTVDLDVDPDIALLMEQALANSIAGPEFVDPSEASLTLPACTPEFTEHTDANSFTYHTLELIPSPTTPPDTNAICIAVFPSDNGSKIMFALPKINSTKPGYDMGAALIKTLSADPTINSESMRSTILDGSNPTEKYSIIIEGKELKLMLAGTRQIIFDYDIKTNSIILSDGTQISVTDQLLRAIHEATNGKDALKHFWFFKPTTSEFASGVLITGKDIDLAKLKPAPTPTPTSLPTTTPTPTTSPIPSAPPNYPTFTPTATKTPEPTYPYHGLEDVVDTMPENPVNQIYVVIQNENLSCNVGPAQNEQVQKAIAALENNTQFVGPKDVILSNLLKKQGLFGIFGDPIATQCNMNNRDTYIKFTMLHQVTIGSKTYFAGLDFGGNLVMASIPNSTMHKDGNSIEYTAFDAEHKVDETVTQLLNGISTHVETRNRIVVIARPDELSQYVQGKEKSRILSRFRQKGSELPVFLGIVGLPTIDVQGGITGTPGPIIRLKATEAMKKAGAPDVLILAEVTVETLGLPPKPGLLEQLNKTQPYATQIKIYVPLDFLGTWDEDPDIKSFNLPKTFSGEAIATFLTPRPAINISPPLPEKVRSTRSAAEIAELNQISLEKLKSKEKRRG